MLMRSPACFILRRVWMVTFFKVHLLVVRRRTRPAFIDFWVARLKNGRAPRRSRTPASGVCAENVSLWAELATPFSGAGGTTHSRAGPQGLVVPGALPGLVDGLDQVREVRLGLDVVDVARVDDEQRGFVVAVEEVVVGARQLAQVARVELALELAAPLLDAGEQHLEPRL